LIDAWTQADEDDHMDINHIKTHMTELNIFAQVLIETLLTGSTFGQTETSDKDANGRDRLNQRARSQEIELLKIICIK